MIKVIAEDFIKHEFIDKVLPLYEELVTETRKEALNISYDLFIDQQDRGHFIFIEEWPDLVALDIHCATEHFRRLVPQMDKYRSKEATVIIMDQF